MSLHINHVLQKACGELCVTLCAYVHVYLCANVTFFSKRMCECLYLFRSLCVCV